MPLALHALAGPKIDQFDFLIFEQDILSKNLGVNLEVGFGKSNGLISLWKMP